MLNQLTNKWWQHINNEKLIQSKISKFHRYKLIPDSPIFFSNVYVWLIIYAFNLHIFRQSRLYARKLTSMSQSRTPVIVIRNIFPVWAIMIYNPVRTGYSIKLETCMPNEILSSLFRHRLGNLHVVEDVILGHVAIPSKQEYGMSTRLL